MIILDASGLIAALDGNDPNHQAAADTLRDGIGPFLISPFVLAEVDYIVSKRVSAGAARQVLDLVAAGAIRIEPMAAEDVGHAVGVIDRYADQAIGLADASIVVLADRYDVRDVLTFDERHFRTMRDQRGRPFRILPVDAE